ncbi:protein PLANT CADMIUM RESISTANCE 7-like [Fagus crenata]
MCPNNNTNPESAPHAPSPPLGQWTTGLCGCFEDPSSCWVTCCCPFITFGRIAEVVDQGGTSCFSAARNYMLLAHIGAVFLYTCTYRTKLRGLYKLPAEPCGDCCVHSFCTACALCQEYRELKNRGLDPSIGWVANEKMKGGTTAPPIPAPSMTR